MSGLDWNKVKSFKSMPKVSDLGIREEMIAESLYRLGEREYAFAPYQSNNAAGEWGSYVTKFIWSPSVHAVEGLILANPGCDQTAKAIPPNELLLEPKLHTFEDILQVVRTERMGEYRAGPAAACASILEKTYQIAVGRLDYFFTSGIEDWAGQTPILICWHTSDVRWKKFV